MNLLNMIRNRGLQLFDSNPDNSGGGMGYVEPGNTPSEATEGTSTSKEEGRSPTDFYKDSYDDEKTPEGTKPPEDSSKEPEEKTDVEEKSTLAGYSEETSTDDKKSEDDKKPADDKKPEDDKQQPKEVDYSKIDISGIENKELAQKVLEFAKNSKLDESATKAILTLKNAEYKVAQKQQQEEAQQRAGFLKELKADPKFGGEGGRDFQTNVFLNEKFLKENMPETHKYLTEQKTMLHPVIMRELNALAKKAYGDTGKFIHGGSKTSEDRKPWDHYKV